MIQFRMLGTMDLRDAQDREVRAVLRRPKLLALLGYLAAARPAGFHRRDTLVALFWPELDNSHARNALRQAIHSLRDTLGRDVILARGEEELGIDERSLQSDVREFAASLESGQREQALELYRGVLLHGLHISDVPEFERWLETEREQLRRRASDAARELTDQAKAANPAAAPRWALRWTELSPFDEAAARRLIELLDRAGDRAGAVRAYEEFERRLGRDLEVQPSSETQALVAGIRSHQQSKIAVARPTSPSAAASVPESVASSPDAPSPRRRVAWVTAVVVITLIAGGWFFFRAELRARSAAAGSPKRLVVLPFANLGPAEDEYFTDGITEEITARLAAIDRLRIIGSTSASRYKRTQKTIPEIGQELGVGYVLEGSVRWEKPPHGPARVRVTPQLVSAADGTHLWAQVYDESLDEIFRVQSDIAQNVVQALHVTLLQPQRNAMQVAPTHNLQAYDYYLRGRDYMHSMGEQPTMASAVRMFEKAVELDTSFALAYAMLSRMHSRMYLFHYDRSPERIAQAKRAVDRALELQPDLPEAHHSLGTYYWLGQLDYDRALQEFAIAEASRPNDSQLLLARAVLRQRQGRLREALVDHERALQLDPASYGIAQQYGLTYLMLRDFAHADALFDRTIAFAPDYVEAHYNKVMLALRWHGSTQRARAILDEARKVGIADKPSLVRARVWVELFDRRYQEAIDVLSSKAPEVFEDQNRFVPRTQLYAQIHGLMGRHDLERAYYDSARVFVLPKVRERPDDPRFRSALGIALAGLGRKQEAIQEGRRAVSLLPVEKEAFRGYYLDWDLARIYTMVGEYDTAVTRLEHLLSIPGWLTPAWLRSDPSWDPLRGHSRFQRLVNHPD